MHSYGNIHKDCFFFFLEWSVLPYLYTSHIKMCLCEPTFVRCNFVELLEVVISDQYLNFLEQNSFARNDFDTVADQVPWDIFKQLFW